MTDGVEKHLNKIICGNCLDVLKQLSDKCIDLTVTSPPYDNLRDYHGYTFDLEGIARELYRVTQGGGAVVFLGGGDATIKGSETGISFRQALYFKGIGFNLHDTMIYEKAGGLPTFNRYVQVFEYMFVLCGVSPETINLIKDKKCVGRRV